jgi:hypothetical protein
MSLEDDIRSLINLNSRENRSHTPDYILAHYLLKCLENFEYTTRLRDDYWQIEESAKATGEAHNR